jgi:hypothetical protein
MTDNTGRAQFFIAFHCAAEHEAEGDEFFAHHAAWIERTHPKDGDLALLQYNVSKSKSADGTVAFLVAEVYETPAGIANHRKLAHDDEDDSRVKDLGAFADKCLSTIGWTDATIEHSLWK